MKLAFRLLVVDDLPDGVRQAIGLLEDYLVENGFSLETDYAEDLSEGGLRKLARESGRNFDLVAVDFNLGRQDIDGAFAAARLRDELRYTDMVFYSSDNHNALLSELTKHDVSGVFVSSRSELDDALTGLAKTVIGKVVDLNHMRGIAMAEVAEMDVQMELILEKVFSVSDTTLEQKGMDTLNKFLSGEVDRVEDLRRLVKENRILDVITNGGLFSSMQRFKAIARVCKVLKDKPSGALEVFKSYDPDIIQNRNILAHAKEDVAKDGTISLRAIKHGKNPVIIDENWMKLFRNNLRRHRAALDAICEALNTHVEALASDQVQKT